VANEERRQERILYRGRRRRENATRFGKLRLPAHAEVATAAHLSVSAFVLRAAAQEAESVLAERPLLSLSAEAAEAFSDALERPGRVNKRLADALGHDRSSFECGEESLDNWLKRYAGQSRRAHTAATWVIGRCGRCRRRLRVAGDDRHRSLCSA
jgi:uncharacterized protein (DUF1778 family)